MNWIIIFVVVLLLIGATGFLLYKKGCSCRDGGCTCGVNRRRSNAAINPALVSALPQQGTVNVGSFAPADQAMFSNLDFRS